MTEHEEEEEARALFDQHGHVVYSARLTAEERAFLKRFAVDGVAGRHVICLCWHFLIALGKLAFALSAVVAAGALLFGWRVHR